MKRWYPYFQIVLLAWALHRIAMAIIGFPVFSFSDFRASEFFVDIGVYVIAFGISYWFVLRRKRVGQHNEGERTDKAQ